MKSIGSKISAVFAGKVCSYLINLLIAYYAIKNIGIDFYGELVFIFSFTNVLSGIYIFGFSNNIEKSIFTENDTSKISKELSKKISQFLILSLLLCALFNVIFLLIIKIFSLENWSIILTCINIALFRALLLLLIRAFRSIRIYSLYALGELPNLLIFLLGLIVYKWEITSIIIFLTCSWIFSIVLYLSILFTKKYVSIFRFNQKIVVDLKKQLPEQFNVMLNTNMVMLGENLPVLILKFIAPVYVGVFDVLKKIAYLPMFILPVTNSIVGPLSLSFFKSGNNKGFEKLLLKISRYSFLITTIYIVIVNLDLFIGNRLVLKYFEINSDSLTNYSLIILCIGYLVHVVSGANNLILNLNGYENKLLKNNLYGLIFFLLTLSILNIVDSNPLFSTTLSCTMYYMVINYLNLNLIKANFGIKLSILQV